MKHLKTADLAVLIMILLMQASEENFVILQLQFVIISKKQMIAMN